MTIKNPIIDSLRDQGYAIVIFSPDEIGDNVDPMHLEHFLKSVGRDYIAEENADIYGIEQQDDYVPEFIRKQVG